MGRIDVDPHGIVVFPGMNRGRHRTKAFAEDAIGAPVEEPIRLLVIGNRHDRDRPLGGDLNEEDAHFGGQIAGADATRDGLLVWDVETIDRFGGRHHCRRTPHELNYLWLNWARAGRPARILESPRVGCVGD